MPVCFKRKYPSTGLILDATEVRLETPSYLEMQSGMWSSYKNTNTLKGLIGITPTGYISFVSGLYCGNISDKRLTTESGVLDTHQPEDGLMADRGFDIGDDCASRNVCLNIPHFDMVVDNSVHVKWFKQDALPPCGYTLKGLSVRLNAIVFLSHL